MTYCLPKENHSLLLDCALIGVCVLNRRNMVPLAYLLTFILMDHLSAICLFISVRCKQVLIGYKIQSRSYEENLTKLTGYMFSTLKVLSKIVADNILIFLFFCCCCFFQRRLSISCESSVRQTIHMKCQALVSLKN